MVQPDKLKVLEESRECLLKVFEKLLPENKLELLPALRHRLHLLIDADMMGHPAKLRKAQADTDAITLKLIAYAKSRGKAHELTMRTVLELLAHSVKLEREIRRGNVVPLNVARWR